MKKFIIPIVFIFTLYNSVHAQTEKTEDYIEFDDRKNVVHGVYIGFAEKFI